MFKIYGDSSYKNTVILKNDKQISYNDCDIIITRYDNIAVVDGEEGSIEQVILGGSVYKLVGDGGFDNTRLYFYDVMLRGIQSVIVCMSKNKHTILSIDAIFLPNIVKEEEKREDE